MKKRLFSVLLALCLALGVLPAPASAADTVDITVTGSFCYQDVRTIYESVNAHRSANGSGQLALCSDLTRVAMKRAAEIAYSYGHVRPNGKEWSDLAGMGTGENIAMGQSTASEVMTDWEESPGHNANMLNPSFTRMGVGVFVTGNSIYWVQIFGVGTAATQEIPTAQATGIYTFPVLTSNFDPAIPQSSFGMEVGATARLPVPYDRVNNTNAFLVADQVTCSDPTVASVSLQGRFWQITSLREGSCELIYELGGRTLRLPLSVVRSAVTIDTGDFTLMAGLYRELKVTTVPAGQSVTWSSSDPSVATVRNGIVWGQKEGTASIIATITSGGVSYSDRVTVTVTPNQVGAITLDRSEVEMEVGEQTRVDITVDPSSTVVTWNSSDRSVVQIFGGNEGASLYGLKPGRATITASSFSHTVTVQVTVYPKGQKPVDGKGPVNQAVSVRPAMPTNDKFSVDGTQRTATIYKIDGNNYFKIRDIAALLDGTDKQFEVSYESGKVALTTDKPYTRVGGELSGTALSGTRSAAPSKDTITINGIETVLTVYKIDGNNYFKLRDLGRALNFYVGWSKPMGAYVYTTSRYSG